MTSGLTLQDGWRIELEPSDLVSAVAAAELHRLLGVGTERSDPYPGTGRTPIDLRHRGGVGDGFTWRVTNDGVSIEGEGPRGLLFGVFDLAEAAGFGWPMPGQEVAPPRLEVLSLGELGDQPDLPGRALIIGSVAFLDRVEDWITWAARNKLNTIFFHTAPHETGGAIPDSEWQKVKLKAVAAIKRYGLVYELGGHWMSSFLSRDRFGAEPNAFRMVDSERRPDSNLCCSSQTALDAIGAGSARFFEANPEVDVFHLWPDDAGSWCQCPRCASLSPSDQCLRATSAMAARLEEANPSAQLAVIAYLETEDPPVEVPPSNTCLLWAPRRRCYGHDLGDDRCQINEPRYRSGYERLLRTFEEAGARPARIFEYWLDGILFKSCLPVFAGMGHDIANYRASGAHTVQALLVGPRELLGPWPTPWLYARLAWRPTQDPAALLARFAKQALGDAGAAEHLLALDAAWNLALELEPIDGRRRWEAMARALASGGFTDMEDPAGADLEMLTRIGDRHVEALEKAEKAALALATGPAAPEAEAMMRWLRFASARVAAYVAIERGDADADRAVQNAIDLAEQFVTWLEGQPGTADFNQLRWLHSFAWTRPLEALRDSAAGATIR